MVQLLSVDYQSTTPGRSRGRQNFVDYVFSSFNYDSAAMLLTHALLLLRPYTYRSRPSTLLYSVTALTRPAVCYARTSCIDHLKAGAPRTEP